MDHGRLLCELNVQVWLHVSPGVQSITSEQFSPYSFNIYSHEDHRFDLLQIVDAIDRHGSFTAAAAALHRVPSALSHAVAKLE
jgi:hypothetical protein